jgi:molybdopterin synthase catalytic subunit
MKKIFLVTKGSDDGTFIEGDHIIFYDDGCIGCFEAGGWVVVDDVPEATKGLEYILDSEYAKKRLAQIEKEAEQLKKEIL